ncbi:MAG TPA: tetratricopeptide repeat protein, partial [Firmicutes bacterium]|nr:tetratricopeptide repeat protein [Bacillota bacterium]
MQNLHDNPYRTTFKLVLKTFVLLLVISGLVAWDLPFASQRARGDNRYRDGKYEEAITHYNRAVEKDPANWELNYNLGTSYYRIGDWEKAVQTLTLAKNLAEKWGAPKSEIGKIYHNLGLSYLQLGDCENAIPALGNAVELEKNDEDMQRNYRFAMEYCEEEGKSGDESEDQNQDGEGESEDEQDQNG